MSQNNRLLPKLFELLPAECACSTGSILYLETHFSNGVIKNKYLALMDGKDPPIFFFINSKKERKKWNECEITLPSDVYSFLHHDSYLDYHTEASSLDYVDDCFPSMAEITVALANDKNRFKGRLRREEAIQILQGIDSNRNDLEPPVKHRIREALSEYIK
ncbi:MAG: hypothetical protein RRY12_00630 [Cloacibacillus sp.]